MRRAGNWLTGATVAIPIERWRVRDGAWHVDVHLGKDVPYGDAEIVVRAIRRRDLIDQRRPDNRATALSTIDPAAITSIERPHQGVGTRPSPSREFEVRTGERGGDSLLVRIVDGRVEVHRSSQWTP